MNATPVPVMRANRRRLEEQQSKTAPKFIDLSGKSKKAPAKKRVLLSLTWEHRKG